MGIGSEAVRVDLGAGNEVELRMGAAVAAIMGLMGFVKTLKLRWIGEERREGLILERLKRAICERLLVSLWIL